MAAFTPLPSIYYPEFIAANQSDRANNVLQGTKQDNLDTIRKDIQDFKQSKNLDKVIVLWTANTERFCDVVPGVNDTAENILAAVERGEEEIAPSTIFALASILEGCSYINGSPQNTFVPVESPDQTFFLFLTIAGSDGTCRVSWGVHWWR
jgi:myo-inositol-1-phosphate synthase